jgi:hypothetical protein
MNQEGGFLGAVVVWVLFTVFLSGVAAGGEDGAGEQRGADGGEEHAAAGPRREAAGFGSGAQDGHAGSGREELADRLLHGSTEKPADEWRDDEYDDGAGGRTSEVRSSRATVWPEGFVTWCSSIIGISSPAGRAGTGR